MDDSAESTSCWIAPFAAVAGACLAACILCGLPNGPWLSWTGLFVRAIAFTFATFLASIVSVRLVFLFVPVPRTSSFHRAGVRAAYAAAGFAPFVLLVQENSAWSVAVAAVLSVTLALILLGYRVVLQENEISWNLDEPANVMLFQPLNVQPYLRQFFPALCAAALAEIAGVEILRNESAGASLVVAVLGVLLVWDFNKRTLVDQRPGLSKSQKALTLAAVLLVTCFSLVPYLRPTASFLGSRAGSNRSPSSALWNEAAARKKNLDEGTGDFNGGYPGIILWPKHQQTMKLVAPSAELVSDGTQANRSKQLLTIPFDGVYWFFKAETTHPLKGAHEAEGSPNQFSIRSTDGSPLVAEAHQSLGSPINLSCCGSVKVEINNADHYPGTVSIELLLRDTKMAGKPALSLGTVPISPLGAFALYEDRPPGNEVLSFTIPRQRPIPEFDELTVIFRLSPNRSLLAARIAIEKFVFMPQGL